MTSDCKKLAWLSSPNYSGQHAALDKVSLWILSHFTRLLFPHFSRGRRTGFEDCLGVFVETSAPPEKNLLKQLLKEVRII